MTTSAAPVHIEDARIDDLHERLARARLAPDHDNDDWRYGVPSRALAEWVERWQQHDWRAAEASINGFEPRRAVIDGVPIWFLSRRGRGPRPMPLLLCHGLPWTFWDWHETLEPLTDPAAHGGDALDAFDVVIPSLPRFPFSEVQSPGPLAYAQMADLLATLMSDELGFEKFGAAGGDEGMLVAGALGHKYPDRVLGIQLFGAVPLSVFTRDDPLGHGGAGANFGRSPSAAALADPVLSATPRPPRRRSGYYGVSAQEPQTLAAGMSDSPLGLLAWLLQHRYNWSDHDGDLLDVYDPGFLLTTMSLFWYTDTFAEVLRVYHDQTFRPWQPVHDRTPVVEAPTGITFFGGDELTSRSRLWCPEFYNLVRVSERERGGHYAPSEVPAVAVEEIRATFRLVR